MPLQEEFSRILQQQSNRPHRMSTVVDDLVKYTSELNLARNAFPAGTIILDEDVQNDLLYIIISGTVEQRRRRPDGSWVHVDDLQPGAFIGLLSFWSDALTFTQTRASEEVTCLVFSREDFEKLVLEHPKASLSFQYLLANSLSDRYRNMVMLNIAVHHLTEQLERDRNQLRETVADLERTRDNLVQKERLALLGNLLSGIAHEINNPSSSLQQSVEAVSTLLPELFQPGAPLENRTREARLLQAGLDSTFISSSEQRTRLRKLQQRYSDLDRPFLRRLVPLSDDVLELLATGVRGGITRQNRKSLLQPLRFFDIGANLKSIQLSNTRISRLVQSLKFYSRPVSAETETHPLREVILNTLTVLHHRLKHYEVEVDLDDLPEDLDASPGISQVVSNILINACDATPEGGTIRIEANMLLNWNRVQITVSDSGSGIPDDQLEKIFETNFTTKRSGGQYGLGLGLSISRDLVIRDGGSIRAENKPDGGARFLIELPL